MQFNKLVSSGPYQDSLISTPNLVVLVEVDLQRFDFPHPQSPTEQFLHDRMYLGSFLLEYILVGLRLLIQHLFDVDRASTEGRKVLLRLL